ncbi:MAG TPA: glycosyltransferase family A protein [Burkholderiales bacterium]|nr:glycosyltransferase family A protein [Burkholderiales bacterium]
MRPTDSNRAPVSTVIPCFRCASTIRRAISSVAAQSFRPAELILVDDGSKDGTLQELRDLRRAFGDDWIKIVVLPENLGPASARNAGWDAATRKYVAFLDADDAWHPRKIEIQHAFMEAHPDVALSGHAHQWIADGEAIDTRAVVADYDIVSRRELLLANRFITPSAMLRRNLPYRFQAGRRYLEDHLLWLEIASAGLRVARLAATLAFTFKAPLGESGLSANTWAMRKAELSAFWHLHETGHLGLLSTIGLCVYSLAKHMRRALLFFGSGQRRK